jgi:hypothetical protein
MKTIEQTLEFLNETIGREKKICVMNFESLHAARIEALQHIKNFIEEKN